MKIVTFNGGNGGYRLLSGLKKKGVDITAVMSCFDSGGSTGILRKEFGGIALGDLRRGFLALGSDKENFSIMKDILKKRFEKGSGLNGHNLGNLLLLSMGLQKNPDSLQKAYNVFGLNERHKVLPPSFTESHLCAELEDGTIINGETNIDVPKHDTSLKIKRVFLKPEAEPYEKVLDEISDADLIVIGPGDLYTSIMQSFLVDKISDAVSISNAKKIFVINTMTKIGETENYKASDFVKELKKYLGCVPDYVISNCKRNHNSPKTEDSHHMPVFCDRAELERMEIDVLERDVVCDGASDLHDPDKLANAIMEVLE